MRKQYQIYGIGNALVDFEIETSDQQLALLKIDKGVMTLIEESRQDDLFEIFINNRHSRACGGSAANTIIGAQSLGSQCFYSCKVANDDTGLFYKNDLLNHGVHSNLSNEDLEVGKTGKCLVLVTDDADRTMNTFLGITGNISYQQIDEEKLKRSEYLYIEGYLAGSPVALSAAVEAVNFAKNNQVKTAFSLSDPNMVKFCKQGLEAIMAEGVDLLFCNEDEALSYTESKTLDEAISHLSQIATTLVVTLGPNGALITTAGETSKILPNSVVAVDTNGAGDLFAGCFLHAITAGFDYNNAAQLASYASSLLVTQFGPRLTDGNLSKVRAFAAEMRE